LARKHPKIETKPTLKPRATSRRRWDLCICAALAAVTLAVYAQVGTFAFVDYDDAIYVTENAHVKAGLSWANAGWAFTTREDANWFPLTWLSHMAVAQFFGLDSGIHHLANLALHVLAALALFLFLKRASGARWPSALAAFLFALHPLHVESVAWVAERKDTLSALFWFLTLWCYVWYVERPGRMRYVLLLAAFCLGLMSKSMLVTLPFVLLLMDLWPLRRMAGPRGALKLIREKIPLFALSTAASAVAYLAQGSGKAVVSLSIIPLGLRIQNAIVSYVIYLAKAFWPAGLTMFYPYPPRIPAWQVAAALILLGSVSVLAVRLIRGYPYLAAGWFWYLGTLVPVIGLVQIGSQARADRYTYIPLTGISIMLAWGTADLLKRFPRAKLAVGLAAAAVCAALSMATWAQARTWANSEALFQHALRVNGSNYIASINLAAYYVTQGRTEEALSESLRAVRLRPDAVDAHTNLAAAYGNLKRHAEAEKEYRAALRLQPDNAMAHSWLAMELDAQGKRAEAMEQAEAAVRLSPDSADAQHNLGLVLGTAGRWSDASARLAEAVRLRPEYAAFRYDLGVALAHQNRMGEAIREFRTAIRLKPDYARAHFNLGSALAISGDLDGAIREFSETLRLSPDYPGARQSLEAATALRGR
jgi:tetratricopeptide (TPR) repeat protein